MPNEPIETVDDIDLDAFSQEFHETDVNKTDHADDDDNNDDPIDKDSSALEDDDDADEDDSKDQSPDEEDEDEVPAEKPKKVNRVQERINELTARAREAERALEALKQEQAKKQDEKPPSSQDKPEASVSAGPDPDAKNPDGSDKYPLGEFDPSYIRDMARHTIDQEWKARKEQEEAEQAQASEKQAREDLHNQWLEKLTPVTEQHADFLEKTIELETTFEGLDTGYSDYLVQTIKSLDHGPEVLYYFANNLEEAQKFVQMGPLQATLALGEMNAMFKGNTRKETKVSSAPPPPQVTKGAKTRTTVSGDTDDLDAFANVFFTKKK